MKNMEKSSRPSARVSRKIQMVAAAEALLRDGGLRSVTTRAIAEAVPCSEGAIYVHFPDRLELILAVLQRCLPEMLVPLHALDKKVGVLTPRQNLRAAIAGLMRFHERVAPMLCALFSERELLQRFRKSLDKAGKGPHRGISTLAKYIVQEQELGRIKAEVDAKTAATILMASSFFHIFTSQLLGAASHLDVKQLIDVTIQHCDTARPSS
jgi:AcrR family transcriptional regulator